MSTPVPLGVRVFNVWGRSFDTWITNLVSDISFRSVIPGGYANATLTLHNDQSNGWTQVAQPLNRIQIVDLRSQEIAWEGRIDTVPRQTSDDTWELGCLGSMVYASDIQRPMFYIDSDVSRWKINDESVFQTVNTSSNTDTKSLTMSPPATTIAGPIRFSDVTTWDGARACDVFVGRVDATLSGSASTANLRTGLDIGANNDILRAWNAASARLTAQVGAGITGTSAVVVKVAFDLAAASNVVNSGAFGRIALPRIQVQRVDETGAKLQTSGSYPQEYLTVEQVVRDVVGRFMVGAWHTAANNTPYLGKVGTEGIYIDTSATAQITHLTYYDGTTAAEILADLMTAQPEAYWALWESRYGATTDSNADARFRFEWATWPTGWSYEASSIDGLEEQPDGGELRNFVWFQHALATDPELSNVQKYWDTANENQLLTDAQLVRGVTVQSEDPLNAIPAFDRAIAIHSSYKRTTNAGTLTVKRPIQAHDAGLNSNSGVSRMLDPWLIRPGKLIRITDIPPRSNSHTFATADAVIDTFGRTASSGWGTASSGAVWSVTGGATSDYSVSGSVGRVSLGSVNVRRFTSIGSFTDGQVTASVTVPVTAVGGSISAGLVARYTDDQNFYLIQLLHDTAGTIDLEIVKRVAGTFTTLTSVSNFIAYTAGVPTHVRAQFVGDQLTVRIWSGPATEPTVWHLTATDAALVGGAVGTHSNLLTGNTNTLPVVVTYDNLTAVSQQAYSPELDGTVFRVVGTTYSSADNSCVLELDQPPAWNTATQVITSARDAQPGGSKTLVRG